MNSRNLDSIIHFTEKTCSEGHALTWYSSCPYEGKVFICNGCRKTSQHNESSFRCDACSYDLCLSCSEHKECPSKISEKCSNGHQLEWFPNCPYQGKKYNCDRCGYSSKENEGAFRCNSCGFDLCLHCSTKSISTPRQSLFDESRLFPNQTKQENSNIPSIFDVIQNEGNVANLDKLANIADNLGQSSNQNSHKKNLPSIFDAIGKDEEEKKLPSLFDNPGLFSNDEVSSQASNQKKPSIFDAIRKDEEKKNLPSLFDNPELFSNDMKPQQQATNQKLPSIFDAIQPQEEKKKLPSLFDNPGLFSNNEKPQQQANNKNLPSIFNNPDLFNSQDSEEEEEAKPAPKFDEPLYDLVAVPEKLSSLKCWQGHNLEYYNYCPYKSLKFSCNICSKSTFRTEEASFRCNACQFDVCRSCYIMSLNDDSGIKCKNAHSLSEIRINTSTKKHCASCQKIFNRDGVVIRSCESCNYNLCQLCYYTLPLDKSNPYKLTCAYGYTFCWSINTRSKRCYFCFKDFFPNEGAFSCFNCDSPEHALCLSCYGLKVKCHEKDVYKKTHRIKRSPITEPEVDEQENQEFENFVKSKEEAEKKLSEMRNLSQQALETYTEESMKSKKFPKAIMKKISDLSKIVSEKDKILGEFMKYISQNKVFLAQYVRDVDIIIDYLSKNIPPENEFSFKIWTTYFNVSTKLKQAITEGNPEIEKSLKEFHLNFLKKFAKHMESSDGEHSSIDWRILRRLKQFQTEGMVEEGAYNEEKDSAEILFEFKKQLLKAYDFLIWHDHPSPIINYCKSILKNFAKYVFDSKNNQTVVDSLILGRFDKNETGLEKSLILGEDGGLYLLLNSLNESLMMSLVEAVGEDFLKGKTSPKEPTSEQRVVIGEGAFGKVRFALSLFATKKTLPGNMICVKKTRNFEIMKKAFEDPLTQIVETTIEDYFSTNDLINHLVYSPKVLDLAFNLAKETQPTHQKGYLMMEVVPQNTGTRVFMKNTKQHLDQIDWVADQKPYIIQVMSQTKALLDNNIAMMDLKPDNTLYDVDNRRAFIIDLGGSLQIDEGVEKCQKNKHDFQCTPAYTSPEFLDSSKKIVDLRKCLSYSCGKILYDIIVPTKENNTFADPILKISESMITENIEARISLEDAIKEITNIGDDRSKNVLIFRRYVDKIKERLEKNKSSISINEDIEDTEKLLIPPKVTVLDPALVKHLETYDLQSKLQEYLNSTTDSKSNLENVMLLLGDAGSGKSIMLQIEFIKAIKNWNPDKPLPIYFNLSNGTDLDNIINSLDNNLKTNLFDLLVLDKSSAKNLTFFIDSFDEGIVKDQDERKNLIKSFFKKLSNTGLNPTHIKFLISCRANFLRSFEGENCDEWFQSANRDNSFSKYYIVPFNYESQNNEEESFKKMIADFLKNFNSKSESQKNVDYYYEKIKETNIQEHITSGFLFHMLMKTMVDREKADEKIDDVIDLYSSFIDVTILKNLNLIFPTTQEQKQALMKHSKALEVTDPKSFDELFVEKMKANLNKIGMYLATTLHMKSDYRIRDRDELFKLLDFETENALISFKNQRIFFLLRNLPLKIEIRKIEKSLSGSSENKEEIAIGFIHDTIKNYFIIQAILQEAREHPYMPSKILGSKYITNDAELIEMFAHQLHKNEATYNTLTSYLLYQIYLTRKIKTTDAIVASANSATLLIASNYTFTGLDLSDVIIRGANLRNGRFDSVNFTNADLSHSKMLNIKLNYCKLFGTDLSNISLNIQPELPEHYQFVSSVSYSTDGKKNSNYFK